MNPIEWLGKGASVLGAPIISSVAFLRRARVFHPRGIIHRADVRVVPGVADELREAAVRLAGPGFIRLSSAWWKTGEKPDLLGVGIRVGDDQDLLFASARSLATLLPATLTTDVHDFLGNDYFAMAPFEIEGVGRVRMKLQSRGASPTGTDRAARLQAAIDAGPAGFDLLVSRGGGAYEPFAHVWLGDRLELDDDALELDPSHAGRGVRPVGFVNAARRLAYGASRYARQKAS